MGKMKVAVFLAFFVTKTRNSCFLVKIYWQKKSNMEKYLSDVGLDDYTEGQFAGSVNTMVKKGSSKKVDRGI